MATYNSPQILMATRHRPIYDGLLHTCSGTMVFPVGTVIAATSQIRLMRVQTNKIVPTRFILDSSGNLDGHATLGSRTLTGDLGYILSVDKNGTNLSLNAAGSAATPDVDLLLASGTTPIIAASVAGVSTFGTTAGAGQLASGGVAVYNTLVAGLDRRGYDANVMDIAVTTIAGSSTALTTAVQWTFTLEFLAVGRDQDVNFAKPYAYDSRYSLTTQQSS